MARALTPIQREEKALEAVKLCAKGWTDTEIGEELGVHRNTVRRLRETEYDRRAAQREHDREKAIAVYLAIIREGWERLRTTKDNSLNVSGLLNAIKAAQDSINKLTGAEVPSRSEVNVTVSDGISPEDMALLEAVEEFRRANDSHPNEVSTSG